MALTTTTTIATQILAKIIEARVIEAGYSPVIGLPLVRVKDIRAETTNVASFTKWPKLTAAAIAEGTALTNTTVTTTAVDVTASEIGINVDVTDKAAASQIMSQAQIMDVANLLGLPPAIVQDVARIYPYADECIKATLEQIDTLVIAEGANAGSDVGTTTVDADLADLIDSQFELNIENAPGNRAAILHPRQVADMQGDTTSNAATAFSLLPDPIKTGMLNAGAGNGFVANVLGVDVYQSTLVPTANAGADRQGLTFPTGGAGDAMNTPAPIGVALKRVTRVELGRAPKSRVTEVVVTADIGVGTINANYMCSITTDA